MLLLCCLSFYSVDYRRLRGLDSHTLLFTFNLHSTVCQEFKNFSVSFIKLKRAHHLILKNVFTNIEPSIYILYCDVTNECVQLKMHQTMYLDSQYSAANYTQDQRRK